MRAGVSESQKKALSSLPVTIVMWGGRPHSGMPDGVRSRTTLHSLGRKGLARVTYAGSREIWTITPLGLSLLN
jgi:hypothetical protein